MVDQRRLARGAKIEQAEHPWATPAIARRIAGDHLREHPREYPARKRR